MGHKQTVRMLLGISVVGIVIGFVLIQPEKFGVCQPDEFFSCIEPLGGKIGQPLFYGSIAVSIIFLLLFFLSQQYFKNWLKYVAWIIPVSILWIALEPVTCGSMVCFDKELATWWASGIYLVLSLAVIIVTYLTRRGRVSTYTRTV